jgi:hypothetical protein
MAKKETYKNVRKNRFTQVSNNMAWDSELSLQGKGLLLIFLSNSETWEINMKEIIGRSKNGRDATYKVVDELIARGYFARIEIRNEKNQFEEMIYIFSDNKEDVKEELEIYAKNPRAFINVDKKKKKEKTEETPLPENQDTGIQDTKNEDTGNQDINNNNQKNTNLNNNKSNNTNLSIHIEDIENSELPSLIKEALKTKIDRLIYHNLSISDILNNYELHKDQITDAMYLAALIFSLGHKKKIGNLNNIMSTNVNKQIEFATQRANAPKNAQKIGYKSTRKEALPEWFVEQQENEDQEGTSSTSVNNDDEQDEEMKEMAAILALYKENDDKEQPSL